MPEKHTAALRRRIAPATPLTLELIEASGARFRVELKLAFDMNAGAAIQETTGLLLTDLAIWKHIGEPKVLKAMLWAATLAHQPQFNSEEGLEVIGSYIEESNADQITDALWKAYLAYLPPAKRELLEKMKADAEDRSKRGDETESPLVETIGAKREKKSSDGSSCGPSPDTTSASASASSAS